MEYTHLALAHRVQALDSALLDLEKRHYLLTLDLETARSSGDEERVGLYSDGLAKLEVAIFDYRARRDELVAELLDRAVAL